MKRRRFQVATFSFNHVEITKANDNQLVLERSKIKALIELILMTLFFSYWYWFLFTNAPLFVDSEQGMERSRLEGFIVSTFYFVPLVAFYRFYLGVTTLAFGNRYIFNKRQFTLSHNGKTICRLDRIEKIAVYIETDSDSDQTYILELMYLNSKRLFVAESGDRQYIYNLADAIASFCELNVDYIS